MKVVAIIPARYQSSRFPGKPLTKILDKPLIIHVAEIASIAVDISNTYVATDDQRIADTVKSYGYKTIMTSAEALTGTDRLYEAAQEIPADIYINIQGDEPMVDPGDIKKIIYEKLQNPKAVVCGMHLMGSNENPSNINIPKVLVDKNNRLIYMSRLPIPGIKGDRHPKPKYLKQVCIYAFTFNELELYGKQKSKAEYEYFEDIEILRFFDLGIPVQMIQTSKSSLAVDIPEDVPIVEKALLKERYDAFLFDFDGVILNSMSVRDYGFKTIFEKYPKTQIEELIKYHRLNGGLSRYVKIRYFFEHIRETKISDEKVLNWAEKYSSIMRSMLVKKENLISETIHFIEHLYGKIPLHIVSGSDHNELNFLCEELGISQYFETIDGSPTTKSVLVKRVLNKFSYQPQKCVLIGDSINDFESAEVNDIVFWGYNNQDLIDFGELYLDQMPNFK